MPMFNSWEWRDCLEWLTWWFILVKSIYQELLGPSVPSNFPFNSLWQWNGPKMIKTHLWLLVHDGLMTNQRRFHRHLASSPNCNRWNLMVAETSLPTLRDCPIVVGFWEEVISTRRSSFFSYDECVGLGPPESPREILY